MASVGLVWCLRALEGDRRGLVGRLGAFGTWVLSLGCLRALVCSVPCGSHADLDSVSRKVSYELSPCCGILQEGICQPV